MRKARNGPDNEAVELLKKLNTFSDKEITELATAGRLVHVPAGWAMIAEKTPGDAAYYILEGEVSIQRNHEEVATLKEGDFIGEVAVLDHKLRSASVLTKTPVTALNLSAALVRDLAARMPGIDAAIKALAAKRADEAQ